MRPTLLLHLPSYECGAPAEAVALIATYDWDFYIIPSWSTRAFFPPE